VKGGGTLEPIRGVESNRERRSALIAPELCSSQRAHSSQGGDEAGEGRAGQGREGTRAGRDGLDGFNSKRTVEFRFIMWGLERSTKHHHPVQCAAHAWQKINVNTGIINCIDNDY